MTTATSSPYRDAADDYLAAGWPPLPLPAGKKENPPGGTTGWFPTVSVTPAKVAAWVKSRRSGNIALRMPDNVIGIDVDHYEKDGRRKRGGDTLAKLERRLGRLPDAPISTARSDGGSGIRFFRVPADRVYRSDAGPDIEVIHRGHRYAVVWPSWHPDLGRQYQWSTGEIPRVDDLPELPPGWVEFLTRDDSPEYREYTKVDIKEANTWLNDFEDGQPCKRVADAVTARSEGLAVGSRHDTMVRGIRELLRLGLEGHRGVRVGLKDLREAFQDALVGERNARAEFNSALKSDVDKQREEPRTNECTCAGEPTDAETPPAQAEERFVELNWVELYANGVPEPDWLVEPLLERGRATLLFSPAKAGKSLLMMEVVGALSCGRDVLGKPTKASSVVYIDQENCVEDIVERCIQMGFTPDNLANLHYFSFPNINALNTPKGGAEVEYLARKYDAAVVVLDTTARLVTGSENDSDTYHSFYQHTGIPLKRMGVAVLRLDHAGKDPDRGPRGSSAKETDVDFVWQMVPEGKNTLILNRKIGRNRHSTENHLIIERRDDPLRHVLDNAVTWDDNDPVMCIMLTLDMEAWPVDQGWNKAYETFKPDHPRWTQKQVREAVQQRKEDRDRAAYAAVS